MVLVAAMKAELEVFVGQDTLFLKCSNIPVLLSSPVVLII